RGPNGTSSVQLESLSSTLADLRAKIHEETQIPSQRQDIRLGFPPKQLDPSTNASSTLESLGIKNGEPVIVSALTEDAPTPSSKAATPPLATGSTTARSIPPPTSSSSPVKREINATPPAVPAPKRSRDQEPKGSNAEWVEVDGGYLVQRIVPDDNSCLFRAVGLVMEPSNSDSAAKLRTVIVEAIKADPDTWNEATLGRSVESYCETIKKPSSWGGAIELALFAHHFKREICSIDVLSGRIDRFGEGEGYDSQVLLVYSGIHYDALTFSYSKPEPSNIFPPPNIDFDQTSFSVEQDSVVQAALILVGKLKAAHAYTDTATFTLKCEQCGTAIVGEKDAREHAKSTGHTAFGEYDG
ncbi:OTU-domain-containing protein, partial [Meredithblackwellia eburnea MCA 4105]